MVTLDGILHSQMNKCIHQLLDFEIILESNLFGQRYFMESIRLILQNVKKELEAI